MIADDLAESGQEPFDAAILLVAVLILGRHDVWMARHGRAIAAEVKEVGETVAACSRTLAALATVVGVAVLREAADVVLVLYGIAVSGNDTIASTAMGGVVGVMLGGGVSALMYFGLLRIPARYLFSVTSWLVALLASGPPKRSPSCNSRAW